MGDPQDAEQVRHELGDVFGDVLRLADVLRVDLAVAPREKISVNEQRYPGRRCAWSRTQVHRTEKATDETRTVAASRYRRRAAALPGHGGISLRTCGAMFGAPKWASGSRYPPSEQGVAGRPAVLFDTPQRDSASTSC
jgi:hypothetical protein